MFLVILSFDLPAFSGLLWFGLLGLDHQRTGGWSDILLLEGISLLILVLLALLRNLLANLYWLRHTMRQSLTKLEVSSLGLIHHRIRIGSTDMQNHEGGADCRVL